MKSGCYQGAFLTDVTPIVVDLVHFDKAEWTRTA